MESIKNFFNSDFKDLEKNLDDTLLNIFKESNFSDSDFCVSYSQFFEQVLNVFGKYQRTVKFITRFLEAIKEAPKKLKTEDVLPAQAIVQFSKALPLLSSQQSLALMKLLVQQITEKCTEISQSQGESDMMVFRVSCRLLTSYLKEVKIYAPSTSQATLKLFVNELVHLKGVLQEFANFIASEKKFVLKNIEVLKLYMELCFYCSEIQALVYCYKDSYSDTLISFGDNWHTFFKSNHWDLFVTNYFKAHLEMCHFQFLQLSIQGIRISKLLNAQSEPNEKFSEIIFGFLDFSIGKLNVLEYLMPDDMILLTNVLPHKQCNKLVNKFLKHILDLDRENNVLEWLNNSRLLENPQFIVSLFIGLLGEVNSVFAKCQNQKDSKMAGLSPEYFDKNNNVESRQLDKLPEAINSLLENSKKMTKMVKKMGEEQNVLRKVNDVFKLLPVACMDKNLKKMGLAFALEMAILCSGNETLARVPLETLYYHFDVDISVGACFNPGLCLKWLSGLDFQMSDNNRVKVQILEKLLKKCANTEAGLAHIDSMIESKELFEKTNPMKALATQIVIYDKLNQCSNRGKKRKSENDPTESCRAKLVKAIHEQVDSVDDTLPSEEHYKLLFEIFRIQLSNSTKDDVSELMEKKFGSYFDFALNKLKTGYDEPSIAFLVMLSGNVTKIREHVPDDILCQVWSALKTHNLTVWKNFAVNSTDSEFEFILLDLLNVTKEFLKCTITSNRLPNYFSIWETFLEHSSEERKNKCQIQLQKLFEYVHDCEVLLVNMPVKIKTQMTEFFCYCLSSKKIVLTTQMLDTVVDVMLECLYYPCLSNEDFHGLFTKQVEAAISILVKHVAWNRSKIHVTFSLFQRMLNDLTRRSDSTQKISNDDVLLLSACAFALEKWVNLMLRMKKDYARISPYFITAIISCITTVTVVSPIKIHLVNCLNSLLNMCDSHSVSYLLRVLKPGYQQVFTSVYGQFRKYHKYSGKV